MVDNKQIQKLNKVLQKQIVQKFGVLAIALLVVGSISYFGTQIKQDSNAATGGRIYLTPATGAQPTGAVFSVDVHAVSGINPVNAVQASLTYNPNQLQFVSVAESTSFPTVAATSSSTPGTIRIARGTAPGASVTGDRVVASVSFRMVATTGTSTIAIDSAFSNIALAADGTNMLSTVTGASYTVQTTTAAGTMSLTPTIGIYAPNSTFPVVIRANSGTELVNAAQAAIMYDATKLQFISITEGTVFTTRAATDTATPGVVRLARGTAAGPVSGAQSVATINFRVIGTTGTTGLTFNAGQSFLARSSDGTNILGTTTGSTYTITAPVGVLGDVNGDSRVNAIDMSILISHDGENYPAADFNKDGTVGAADLAIVIANWTW